MSTKIEKIIKKRFYTIINRLVIFNNNRFKIPFSKLTIDFFANNITDVQATFHYGFSTIYINTFHFNESTIDYTIIHEITHFLIYCSFDNSLNLFNYQSNNKHSTHSLFFSIYNDLLLLCLGYNDRQHFFTAYNYHEDPDFILITKYLHFDEYINAIAKFGENVNDYYDLFLTSSYIYNFLKCGEIVPSKHYNVEVFTL